MGHKQHQKYVFSLLVIFATFLLFSTAEAARSSKFLKIYDLNNDTRVSKTEFDVGAKKRFDKIDSDHNQKIDVAEFKQWRQLTHTTKKRHRYTKMDLNADGQISEAEFLHSKSRHAKRRFMRLDSNHDGSISKLEFSLARKGRHNFKKSHHKSRNRRFKNLDIDNNGEITFTESLLVWSKWFNKLDRNNDNTVTQEEIITARKK